MDIRLQQLSYSSLLTLHSCPRRFQLDKIRGKDNTIDPTSLDELTFAYGHLVGSGIQKVLAGVKIETIIWEESLAWPVDLLLENPKQNKSFWRALQAVMTFSNMKDHGYLDDYELVYLENGEPAVELSFVITLPDGFRFRGYVDVVLKNKRTNKVVVLELKTNSAENINPAMYKNSSQALGYSVVLDFIYPDISSYEVLYLVYKSKSMAFEQLTFQKTYLQRAQWIQQLLFDIEIIKMYEEADIYPNYGESCFSFFRECEYFGNCTMNTTYLAKAITEKELDKIENTMYHYNVTLEDLIEVQMKKAEKELT